MATTRATKAELLSEIGRLEFRVRFAEGKVQTNRLTMVRDAKTRNRLRDELRVRDQELRALRKRLIVPPEEKLLRDLIDELPAWLQKPIREIAFDLEMKDTIRAVMARERDFKTPLRALLAGVAMDRRARNHMDESLDRYFATVRPRGNFTEVVIGGGFHAAIYCAVRVAKGFPRPFVITDERVGGAFAVTQAQSFYLNSRNRPGDLSLPGLSGALNVLPGAPLQPSEVNGDEYQGNDTLGFLARMTLAMNAVVCQGRVEKLTASGKNILLGPLSIVADRVIVATGIGNKQKIGMSPRTSDRILSFDQFMRRMDAPFPLQGMKRVAVIGAGDSGKTVIEALTGQGPPSMSSAALDWPEQIDWYGLPTDRATRQQWENCSRSRYKGIGRLLPDGRRKARVQPKPRAFTVNAGYESVYVNETPYDCAIECVGFFEGPQVDIDSDLADYALGGMVVGKRAGARPIFVVGPAARLAVAPEEEVILSGVSENRTSLFRYAPRTAALAAGLS